MTKKNKLSRRRETVTTELVITDPQQYGDDDTVDRNDVSIELIQL
jgi:hypothetical protein